MKKCGLYIEGLGAERTIEKLRNAEIVILEAEKPQKNAVVIWVDGKDCAKAFAILKNSCYNIKKLRYRGALRIVRAAVRSGGLVVGALIFCCGVCFAQSRVLRIDVLGSGAYYADAVKSILREDGTKVFSAAPKQTASLSEKILALPRVTFCSFKTDGGILTVTVEVDDEAGVAQNAALVAPADGIVESVVVVRGTALVRTGDAVKAGDVLVGNYTLTENGAQQTTVIAHVKLARQISCEYALDEKQALAQAYLDFGELTDQTVTPTEQGVRVEGTAHIGVSANMN